MKASLDRLYDLLPLVYRQRDAEQGFPLRALLQVISTQVNVVEEDIDQLYDNWFIETCEDWVVPYIGDLLGYRQVHEAGEPGDPVSARAQQRNKILIPRREVANTIRYRRRKGTLALLELLANDAAGWPARAVEFYKLLSVAQAIDHLRLERHRTAALRDPETLDRLDGPFDELAHTVDVRSIASRRAPGVYNIPNVGLFIWRLRPYPVSMTPAYCLEQVNPHCFTFSVLGNDSPLFTKPLPEAALCDIAGELNVPAPIRRSAFASDTGAYYGEGKSLYIWEGVPPQPVALQRIVAADLSHWFYQPKGDHVAVDPELGRIVFPASKSSRSGVWVSYHYGFSADMGGGEYTRPLSAPPDATLYRVGQDAEFARLNDALQRWHQDQPKHGVIEIQDSGVYVEQINIELAENQTLQLRAAQRTRPVIRLLDWQTDRPDALWVTGEAGSRFTLDGLLVTGRGVQAEGRLLSLLIRHSTLVPGWVLDADCEPCRPTEPSLEVNNSDVCIVIEHSIIGSIQIQQDEVRADPNIVRISDSILDATSFTREALGAPSQRPAHTLLSVVRSTVFGQVQTHAIELAENSIFMGRVQVARRQLGCMRFCYVTPGSRTPRRYRCQPDLVTAPIHAAFAAGELSADQRDSALTRESTRVCPLFTSRRYGTPAYCQLALACAEEIKRGADDESEMGAFHDLYQPQRDANLRNRLEEYTPAGMEAGILYVT